MEYLRNAKLEVGSSGSCSVLINGSARIVCHYNFYLLSAEASVVSLQLDELRHPPRLQPKPLPSVNCLFQALLTLHPPPSLHCHRSSNRCWLSCCSWKVRVAKWRCSCSSCGVHLLEGKGSIVGRTTRLAADPPIVLLCFWCQSVHGHTLRCAGMLVQIPVALADGNTSGCRSKTLYMQ